MFPRFTISAGLFLLCSSGFAVSASATISVSGYLVPASQQDAAQAGYRHESLSFGFVRRWNGYTNAKAEPGQLCRAFTQPDGQKLEMIATYKTGKGCDDLYVKQVN